MRLQHTYFKTILTILFSVLLIPLVAQDNLTFSDWDADGDNFIERHEFLETFTEEYYHDWDHTDDKGLDDEDFYNATFAALDVDDDGYLVENEWGFGYDHYFGDFLYEDYLIYDMNDDGVISYAEYRDSLYDSDYFRNWDVDRDEFLSEYELAEAVFKKWDLNNNGVLTKTEYSNFDAFYLDI